MYYYSSDVDDVICDCEIEMKIETENRPHRVYVDHASFMVSSQSDSPDCMHVVGAFQSSIFKV